MAMIKCVECGADISDQAAACPKCGCPNSPKPKIPPQERDPAKLNYKPKKKESEGWLVTKMIVMVLVVLWFFMGGGCEWIFDTGSKQQTPAQQARDKETRELMWLTKGREAARSKLKDPDSASFRGVYFNRGTSGIPMACGEVNSQNSLGGYSGFQRFVSAGNASRTYLEEQVSDFEALWREFCL